MSSPPLSLRDQSIESQGHKEGPPQGSICSAPLAVQGTAKAAAAQITTADVIASPSRSRPALKTFEELEIPPSFRTAVESELTEGEKVLWLGRPSRDRRVHPSHSGLTMVGVAMIVLGLGIISVTLGAGGGLFPCVFGGALVIIGSAFLLPGLIDPGKVCRSCYVVTNRRAMIVENSLLAGWGGRARSYLPQQLVGLERRNHPEVEGAGDLIFEYHFVLPGNSFDQKTGGLLQQGAGLGMSNVARRVARGFLLLDQVREVEGLIRDSLLTQLEMSLGAPEQAPTPGAAACVAPEPSAETISATCACGLALEAPASLAGKPVQCPQCSAAVTISASRPAECHEEGQLPADLRAKVLADLDDNETLVWVGQPQPRLVFLRSSAWCAGACLGVLVAFFWLIGNLLLTRAVDGAAKVQATAAQKAAKKAPAPPKAAAPSIKGPVVLLLVSAGFMVVPFVRRHLARRTCYALTNRRALVYRQGLFGPTRESYPPLEVSNMRRSNSWLVRGCGDLIFRSVTVVTQSRQSARVKTTHYGFLAIEHVQDVERLVRETLINPVVDRLAQASYLATK